MTVDGVCGCLYLRGNHNESSAPFGVQHRFWVVSGAGAAGGNGESTAPVHVPLLGPGYARHRCTDNR